MEYKGIDISYHQGDIDFEKLKTQVDFIMVRTSYGSFYKDKKCEDYIKEIERLNIAYGLYHFSYANTLEKAKKEAEGFLNLIKNYNPSYPVVFDIESNEYNKNVDNKTLIEITKIFCETVESRGYYVMIYSNLSYFNNKLNDSSLDKYDKWLAQWTEKPTYNKKFGIWQYTSKGSVLGIKGNVDLNISYYDYKNIIKNKEIKDKINYYVVKKNDTLIKIAKKFNTDYKYIAKINNISNPNLIYENQIIKIKDEDDYINPIKYIVKKNDTLIKIAQKYNKNWKELYEKNKKVIGNNPNLIKVGQVLDI